MIVGEEHERHYAAVRQLHIEAFPTLAEADLVEQLRRSGDAVISLAAFDGERVVGHAMFSAMRAPFKALGLGPVSVVPDRRRSGVAAEMIKRGIARAHAGHWDAIFVLGSPAYYARFGFSADTASGFASPYAGPHLMALALGGIDISRRDPGGSIMHQRSQLWDRQPQGWAKARLRRAHHFDVWRCYGGHASLCPRFSAGCGIDTIPLSFSSSSRRCRGVELAPSRRSVLIRRWDRRSDDKMHTIQAPGSLVLRASASRSAPTGSQPRREI
jgi:putative acetyltransferase